MSAHTPGPWKLKGYQVRANDGHGPHVSTYQICEADGHLMAAAPELLASLEEIASNLDYQHENWHSKNKGCGDEVDEGPCPCTRARAAIAKARGGK